MVTVSTDLRKFIHPKMIEIFKIPDELHESGTQPALPTGYGSSPRKHIAGGEFTCVFWFQYGYPVLLLMNHLVMLSKELPKTFSVRVPHSFDTKMIHLALAKGWS
ncbi:MAG: hypothetical protein ACFFC7_31095 [Candidatus Hermodarchaeota archaeon]